MKRLTGMRVIARAGVSLLGLAAVALFAARPPAHAVRTPMVAPHHLTALERLNFEPNRGQAPASTRFVAHGPGYGLLLNSREAELVLHAGASLEGNRRVRLTLAGARDVAGAGVEPRTGYSNYLIGRNRAKWLRRVPWYGKVRFHDVYPGIDVVYYGRKGELEYDLVAAPGADPGRIRLHIEGASRIRLTADGDLELGLGPGTLRIRRPVMYQMIGGARRPVSGGFVLRGHDVAFRVAQWDRAKSLIIDPVLLYSTYLGGSGADRANGIAVDSTGAAYVTGLTASTDFPTVTGSAQTTSGGGSNDVFVSKLNPDGTALVYSTYLGGSGDDEGNGIAIDSSNAAYITGFTASSNFPVTPGAAQTTNNGGTDAFVAKLSADGTTLVYSTCLGGSGTDQGNGIAVDSSGNAYVTGSTTSANFPAVSAYQSTLGGGTDAFMTVVNAAGSAFTYSSYLGGSGNDVGNAITWGSGGAYFTGSTTSTDLPTTHNSISGSNAGGTDAFVANFGPGSGGNYVTYAGGSGDESGNAIVLGGGGGNKVYIAGSTTSSSFANSNGTKIYGSLQGGQDAFVEEVNPGGAHAYFISYLGGTGTDTATGMAVDSSENIYVTGSAGATTGATFQVADATYKAESGGDAFVAELTGGQGATSGHAVAFSYFGGGSLPTPHGIALDSSNNIYLAGDTTSSSFPVTSGAYQTTAQGADDAFVTKLALGAFGVDPASVTFPGTQGIGVASTAQTVTITNQNPTSLTAPGVSVTAGSSDFSETNTCTAAISPGDSCTISVDFTPTTGGTRTGTLSVTSGSDTQTIPLKGTGSPVSLSPTSLDFGNQTQGVASSAKPVTLTNNDSTNALSITSITASGDFSATNTCSSGVAASGTCTVSVTFTPTATGARSGTLTVVDGDGTQTLALSGTGTAAGSASLSVSTLDLGSEAVSQTSAAKTVTLTNGGTSALSITSVATTGDFAQTNTCGSSVAASGTCTISVTFTPTATGARSGTLTVTDGAGAQTATLSGTGVEAQASLSASSLDLGSEPVGQTSAAKTLTLSNPGTVPLAITSISTSGDFGQSNTCGTSVAAGQSCTISVTFTPTAAGARSGNLTVVDGAGTQTAALNGVAPEANLSAGSLDLGSATVGQSSSAKTITLSNPGTVALPVSSITTSGDFSQTNTCGTSVAAGASCTISVVFTPMASGARSGTLTVADGAGTQSAALSGVAPQVSLSVTRLDLGSTAVGAPSAPQSATLNNTGTVALPISSIAATGDFSETNTCGTSLTAGQSCTITVVFTPATSGPDNGALTLIDGAGTQVILLTGTAAAPEISLSPSNLTFPSTVVGAVSHPQTVTLANNGSSPLVITSIAAGGDFSETNNCPATVAVGASCSIAVTFQPLAVGARTGAVAIVGNAGTQIIALSGSAASGGSSSVLLSPTSLAFGSLGVGAASTPESVSISNNGTLPLAISSITTSGDFAQTNNCPATLNAGSSCSAQVSFTPTATGDRTGTLVIYDSADGGQQVINLSGSGSQAGIRLSPSNLIFGSQSVGSTSNAQTVVLTNSGSAAVTLSGITASSDFQETDNCPASLDAGKSCNINVSFAPVTSGARSGNVVINNSAGTAVIGLSGIGITPGLQLAPATLAFGSVPVNADSNSQTVTLTNVGATSLSVSGISTDGDFTEQNDCGTTLAAGASCTVNAVLTPTVTGQRTGNIIVQSNASGGTQVVALSGSGIAPGVTLNPTSLFFGSQPVGTTSPAQTITVTNAGSKTLNISGIAAAGDFSETNTCGATLASGASCTVSVTLTPSGIGTRTGTVTISDDAPGGAQVVTLNGAGTPFGIRLTPSTLNFGSQPVGSTTPSQTVTLTNGTPNPLTVIDIGATGNLNVANDCGASVAVGASCTLSVSVTPSLPGTVTGSIVLDFASAGTSSTSSGGLQRAMRATAHATSSTTGPAQALVAVTGDGTKSGLLLTPSTLAFGSQAAGTTSDAQNVVVTNSSGKTMGIMSITPSANFTETDDCGKFLASQVSCTVKISFTPPAIGNYTGSVSIADDNGVQNIVVSGSGIAQGLKVSPSNLTFGTTIVGLTSGAQTVTFSNSGSAAFPIDAIDTSGDFTGGNNCGTSLAAGSSCTLTVAFAPAAAGTRTGTLTIQSGGSAAILVPLQGTGSKPLVTISPSSLSFADQVVGTSSATQAITLSNAGTGPVVLNSIVADGDFTQTNNCGQQLAGGATCSIAVTFTPQANGQRTGDVTVSDDAGLQQTTMSGNGSGSPLTISASTLVFPLQMVTIPSAAENVVLTNTGSSALAVSGIQVGGDYAQTNTCGASIAAGASCTVQVTFTPTAIGNRNSTLTITDSAPASPQSLPILGSGMDLGLSSPDTAGKTVNAGGVADYTAVLTPLGGFTGPVKLACSGNPLHSSCVLGTNEVTMGSDPQNVKVSVVTVGPPTASHVLPPPVSTPLSPLGGLVALGMIPLLLLALMLMPGGRRRRALVLVAGVAILAFSLAGCGNDHDADDPTGPAPSVSTAPGHYVITVTATTVQGVQRSVKLPLTVQ